MKQSTEWKIWCRSAGHLLPGSKKASKCVWGKITRYLTPSSSKAEVHKWQG